MIIAGLLILTWYRMDWYLIVQVGYGAAGTCTGSAIVDLRGLTRASSSVLHCFVPPIYILCHRFFSLQIGYSSGFEYDLCQRATGIALLSYSLCACGYNKNYGCGTLTHIMQFPLHWCGLGYVPQTPKSVAQTVAQTDLWHKIKTPLSRGWCGSI